MGVKNWFCSERDKYGTGVLMRGCFMLGGQTELHLNTMAMV